MREFLILAGVALAAAAAGAFSWRHYAPRSFWLIAVFPFRAAHLYLTWAHVASGCGLTSKRRRWRWTLEAVPVAGTLARSTGQAMTVTSKRRVRRVDVEHAPRLGIPRPGPLGWRVRVKLLDGQVPGHYAKACEQIAHAWRVHAVRVTGSAPGRVWLATTRAECGGLLDDLVRLLADRMRLCRTHGARNIWRLPDALRPVPVVVLVDEVAELFLMADKSEKDEIARTGTALLRVAQLGRAFGVYLIVCGQRIGSDLGPGVTALRSQLSGRICHRVNDPETANMTLGDMDPAALDAARAIPAETPGVAIVAGQDGSWYRVRSVEVTEEQAEAAARQYASLTPSWAELTATGPVAVDTLDAEDADDFGDQAA
jgi:hypothetical protein